MLLPAPKRVYFNTPYVFTYLIHSLRFSESSLSKDSKQPGRILVLASAKISFPIERSNGKMLGFVMKRLTLQSFFRIRINSRKMYKDKNLTKPPLHVCGPCGLGLMSPLGAKRCHGARHQRIGIGKLGRPVRPMLLAHFPFRPP